MSLNTKDKKTGLYFLSFSRAVALREVIVGVNSTITEAELRRALGSKCPGVEMYKARLAFRTFGITRHKLDKIGKGRSKPRSGGAPGTGDGD